MHFNLQHTDSTDNNMYLTFIVQHGPECHKVKEISGDFTMLEWLDWLPSTDSVFIT